MPLSQVVGHRWSKSVLKVTDRLTEDFQGNPGAAGQAVLHASPAGQEDGRPPLRPGVRDAVAAAPREQALPGGPVAFGIGDAVVP